MIIITIIIMMIIIVITTTIIIITTIIMIVIIIIIVMVVITIIGLLASMLLPALSKGKESARSIACLNKIKQIGLASNVYSDDHDGHVPTFRTWL